MAWGDRASARYSVELVEKKPSAGRWLMATMDVLTGSAPDTSAEFEFSIKDQQSGAVLVQETFGALAGEEAMRLAQQRLEQMTAAEFADTYSLPAPD